MEAQRFDLGYLSEDVDLTPSRDPENLQRLSEALTDLGAMVRASTESFPFAHDAQSLARAAVWNLRCEHGDFDVCFEPAGIGGYDELARSAHTVLVEVDGETLPVRCADLAHIVRSKQAADRPKDRHVMALLVSQLDDRDNRHRGDRGLGR